MTFLIFYHKSMEILNGKLLSSIMKDKIKESVKEKYIDNGLDVPCLACIIVGENPASKVYVASKEKACEQVGFKSIVKRLPEEATESQVKEVIEELNNDKNVSGILLQLPLPNGLNELEIISTIDPKKDVDGLTEVSLGKLFSGTKVVAPCTAIGVIDILEHYNIPLQGKNVVVIGRSLLVGKSVSILLQEKNATVTMCHSKTQNLSQITKQADILVVAIGRPKFVTEDMVKDGCVIVDVGINRLEKGLVGDVDFEAVKDKCSFITPVPGGVGPMTIAELLNNTLKLHTLYHEK